MRCEVKFSDLMSHQLAYYRAACWSFDSVGDGTEELSAALDHLIDLVMCECGPPPVEDQLAVLVRIATLCQRIAESLRWVSR